MSTINETGYLRHDFVYPLPVRAEIEHVRIVETCPPGVVLEQVGFKDPFVHSAIIFWVIMGSKKNKDAILGQIVCLPAYDVIGPPGVKNKTNLLARGHSWREFIKKKKLFGGPITFQESVDKSLPLLARCVG